MGEETIPTKSQPKKKSPINFLAKIYLTKTFFGIISFSKLFFWGNFFGEIFFVNFFAKMFFWQQNIFLGKIFFCRILFGWIFFWQNLFWQHFFCKIFLRNFCWNFLLAKHFFSVTVGICLRWSQEPTFKVWSKLGQ